MTTLQTLPDTEPAAEPVPPRRRMTFGRILGTTLKALAVGAASLAFLYPFLWLISASFKPTEDVFDNILIPQVWQPENYVDIWEDVPLLAWIVNSVLVTFAAAFTVTIASGIVAFGFAHFRFPGRNALFGLVIGSMMLPAAVTMIPVYLIWNSVGLASSQVPLWAGNLFGTAFYIFLLRQFMLGMPREILEAARMDGASYWKIYWRMVVPLCRPALIVTFIFEVQASWTDLMKPLIYLRDPDLFTIPRGLKAVLDQFGAGGEMQWQIVAAASVITTVPMIIVFFLAQRHFVSGIATSARKG